MNSDRNLKTHAFLVITDMFVCIKDKAMDYFTNIMVILEKALNAAVIMPSYVKIIIY
jgi:hypothetical protein